MDVITDIFNLVRVPRVLCSLAGVQGRHSLAFPLFSTLQAQSAIWETAPASGRNLPPPKNFCGPCFSGRNLFIGAEGLIRSGADRPPGYTMVCARGAL